MPTRNQTLAASQVLFVSTNATGAAPASSIFELYNVQNFTFDVNNNLEPVYALGQRAPQTREALDTPEITFNFDYNITNFDNENHLGLVVNGLSGVLSKIINGSEDEKNYFLAVAGEGIDGIGSTPANNPCLGFGNGNLTSYSFTAQVGSFPTVSVAFSALNAKGYLDSVAEYLPSIDPDTGLENSTQTFTLPVASGNARYNRDAILRPGDIQVDFSNVSGLFYSLSGNCVESVSIDFDLGREALNCLGRRFSKARSLSPQIDVNTSIVFQAPYIQSGSVASYFCGTGLYNATVTARRPACNGTGVQVIKYDLRGLSLNHEGAQVNLGSDGTSITMDFISSIGSSNDFNNNLILSGSFN